MNTIDFSKFKYANLRLHSDVEPYEIVKVVSNKTLIVRPMHAKLDPTWKPEMHAGGFVAHTSNNYDQKWIITSDVLSDTVRIRLHKNGTWHGRSGRFTINEKPIKFHDYNF